MQMSEKYVSAYRCKIKSLSSYTFGTNIIITPSGNHMSAKIPSDGKIQPQKHMIMDRELRAYPKSPDALNVIHAHARCNNAR